MTRIELIKLIGDVLTKLDVLRGSLLPTDINRTELDSLRTRLDASQLKLSKNKFDDNTNDFIKATEDLAAINKELKITINKIEKVVTTLNILKRFVAVIDDILKIVLSII